VFELAGADCVTLYSGVLKEPACEEERIVSRVGYVQVDNCVILISGVLVESACEKGKMVSREDYV